MQHPAIASSNSPFTTIGGRGGSTTHTQTINEMPSHSHTISEGNGKPGSQWSLNAVQDGGRNTTMGTNKTGGGAAMSILNPYIVVNYEVVAL